MEKPDCKTIEREIESFFDDDLDTDELDAFLVHIDSCKDCREELTIRLLIRIGLKRLEDGRNFNLGDEFGRLMKTARSRLVRRKRLHRIAGYGVGAVILGILTVAVISWFVLL